jgi:radical SAM protein with 4Fe4S-binding SPASM domain
MGLLISLHGCDVDSHEAFSSVCGSFQETVENIRRAVDAGLVVATSTVLTRYNVLRLEEIVDFALSLGAQHAVFNRYLGASLPSVEPTMEELRDGILVLESMIRSGAPVRYGNPVPQCFAFNSSRGCAAGKSYCTIDPWGNLRPCNHSPTIVGNLFEQSLEALWHSDGMEQWRALIPSECQSCPEVAACSGGCKALAELRVERCDPLNSRRVGIDNVSPSQLNQKTRSVVLQEVKHGF